MAIFGAAFFTQELEETVRAAERASAIAAAAIEQTRDAREREFANALLRHARGLKVAAQTWRDDLTVKAKS